MSKSVCYGDVLFIDLDDTLLYSSGFFDANLYTIPKQNLVLRSFRQGLFKIVPDFTYREAGASDELENQLDLLRRLNPENTFGADLIA
jgi:hypothetical protein